MGGALTMTQRSETLDTDMRGLMPPGLEGLTPPYGHAPRASGHGDGHELYLNTPTYIILLRCLFVFQYFKLSFVLHYFETNNAH